MPKTIIHDDASAPDGFEQVTERHERTANEIAERHEAGEAAFHEARRAHTEGVGTFDENGNRVPMTATKTKTKTKDPTDVT